MPERIGKKGDARGIRGGSDERLCHGRDKTFGLVPAMTQTGIAELVRRR